MDYHAYARKLKTCQLSVGKERKPHVPLWPIIVQRPSEQCEMDVIGEINPHSSLQHKYILNETYYFTKWVESISLSQINENEVIDFTEKHLITKFKMPSVIGFDNASYFSSLTLFEFVLDNGIILRYSSN